MATYLMYGLLIIIALAAGVMALISFPGLNRSGNSVLTNIGESSQQIRDAFTRDEPDSIQAIVDQLSTQPNVIFCAVMSDDGQFLAHTSQEFVGKKSPRVLAANTASGIMERISYLREDHTGPREYWVPLRDGTRVFGMLQVGVQSEPIQNWMSGVTGYAGIAAALPLLLLVIGGRKLSSTLESTSAIERQLTRIAGSTGGTLPALHAVEDRGAAAQGWNLLVEQTGQSQSLQNLESRLCDALGGFRDHHFSEILHSLKEGVAATNERGEITFCNSAFALLLDTDLSHTEGCSVFDLIMQVMPEQQHSFEERMKEASRPAVVELQRTSEAADGVLRLSRTPIRRDNSDALHHVWSLRDVTQQKLVEKNRDQFVDTASHELRTPLANIRACAETLELEETLDLETQKQYLNTISMEAIRLGRFVDEFLNISRIEAGSLSLNRHDIFLDRLISEVVTKVQPQMDVKKIDFNVELPAKLPEIDVDKDKISAALVNLLGNAAKYTPNGGRVSLSAQLGETEIRIVVDDSGIGIEKDEVARVFNKFFRSDDERVRDITGTGLGLSFAQEVVRLHGGSISVQSELNVGSRFTMTLPLS